MNIALYARVSSEKQAEKDLSISAQLRAMRAYAVNQGWKIVKEFVDEAESARTADRPAFQEMIALAKQKNKLFDIILVWKLSRFARNREDSIIYKSLLNKHGVIVRSVNEQIDDSPSGKLFEGIIEVMDEFYSSNLSQDTIRGMKENATRGFRNGGTIPIGYKPKKIADGNNHRTTIEPDEEFAPIIQRIFQMSLSGMGAKDIVKKLNSEGLKTNRGKNWSKNSIYYILTNEVYIGTLVWKNKQSNIPSQNNNSGLIKKEDNHPPIIDKKSFANVQNLLKLRSPKVVHPKTINSDYLLSGFVYCGKCGAKMVGTAAKSSKYFYYTCNTTIKKGKECCDAKQINRTKLEDFIIERVRTNILTEQNLIELVKLTNDELRNSKSDYVKKIKVIEKQINSLQKRLDKLYDALETDKLDIEYLAPRIKDIKDQIDILEANRISLQNQIDDNQQRGVDIELIKHFAEDLKGLLNKGSIMERKSFLRSFVKRITIDNPRVIIEYTLPLDIKKAEPRNLEVLHIKLSGSPGCYPRA